MDKSLEERWITTVNFVKESKENRTLLDITGSYSLGQVAPYPPSSGLRFSLPRVRKAA